MTNAFPHGSEWRRWDLHIHTPGTQKNDNFTGTSLEEKWDKFYKDVSEYVGDGTDPVKNIAVMAITDYLSLDNYKKVLNDRKLPDSIKLILPNVEMRITPTTTDSPINLHFIFNPEIVPQLNDRFFNKLKFKVGQRPYSASRNDLINLGSDNSEFPAESLTDDEKYKAGINQFVPSLEAVTKIFEEDPGLRDDTIILVSNSSNDGVSGIRNRPDHQEILSKKSQLETNAKAIYHFVDAIFSSSPSDIKYFLGEKETCPPEKVIEKCGSLKPCVHGCDAHSNPQIFEPANQKYCWIKADPTFNGLKQILYEPKERVKISAVIPDYKPDYHVIDSIQFNDDSFQKDPIYLNENLTCIIGGKSTGKSTLLHNLAHTLDSRQVEEKTRYVSSKPQTISPLTVKWKDNSSNIQANDISSRKIVYLPQTYLNRLSDEKESKTDIDNIIEDIIWNHPEIKTSHQNMIDSINHEKELSIRIILDLVATQNQRLALENEIREIGCEETINAQIKKLTAEKDKLSATSDLTLDELTEYNAIRVKLLTLERDINFLSQDQKSLLKTTDFFKAIDLNFIHSAYIKHQLQTAINDSIKILSESLSAKKAQILSDIENSIKEKTVELNTLREKLVNLQAKIDSNSSLKEITKKEQEEQDKIIKLNNLRQQIEKFKEKEKNSIVSLSQVFEKFKKMHNEYASFVSQNFKTKDMDLSFSVVTRLKSNAFSDKISSILDNRSSLFKELFPSPFPEESFTTDFFNTIIQHILLGSLPTKKDINIETALRDICDDYFESKYVVQMDNDTIDVMSPGKKALVLLRLLIDLADSNCPILIDQPEDDLDNRSIFNDLIPFIKKKKKTRQIIIVTHNANIVLGADAEEVIVANQDGQNSPNEKYRFEYVSGSIENNTPPHSSSENMSHGILYRHGIQKHICDILEGGERAFKLRKNKYHI